MSPIRLKSVAIRTALPEDAIHLAPRLRQADKDEIYRWNGMEPEAALLWSLKVSTYRLVCEVNGAVECMFGVGAQSPISDVGYPWLLSSPVPINWPREFNTVTAQVIKQMKVGYDHLENWVDVHNIIAVHWLKNHGFTFDEEPVLSQMGEPFYHFHWRR